MNIKGYDPIERAGHVSDIVCRGDLRKYYRFRPARFYGGIATADCVGCCLKCLFCWSWREVIEPDRYGRFYSPEQVAETLAGIAGKKGFDQVRISGNEPTISRNHLLGVLERIPEHLLFILETNGILIGYDESFARQLSRFKNLYVRISFKGCSEEEFSRLTGSYPGGFHYQLRALEYLYKAGVNVNPAVMISFSTKKQIHSMKKRLKAIHGKFEHFEVEELVLYGDVEKRLKKANICFTSAYSPHHVPEDQI